MTISRLIVLVIALGLTGYIGINIQRLRAPPPLTLLAPAPGLTTSSATVEIRGKTVPGAQVRINGALLPPFLNGEFGHLLTLGKGVNTLTVEARKRYSKPSIIERQIFILGGEKISARETAKISL